MRSILARCLGRLIFPAESMRKSTDARFIFRLRISGITLRFYVNYRIHGAAFSEILCPASIPVGRSFLAVASNFAGIKNAG